ncbi:MAG: hypothetical protein GF393_00220 [Armatimonadia bacterium]|nr:hypothetical protein [Armatimonadia bacterium]
MRTQFALVAVALALAAGVACAGVTFEIGYDFDAGSQSLTRMSATIDGVEMGNDVPLAVSGAAAVDLTLEVLEVDDDGVATIRATFGEVEARLMEEAQEAGTPDPVDLRLDRRGALVGVTSADAPEIDLFASGGVPLQLVVLLAGAVQMRAEPVGLGESWTIEGCQQVPQVGEITMHVTSQITEVTTDEIVVVTDIQASLPDFTTANPMGDEEVTVQNGVLTIEGMRRTVDMKTGLIKSAAAEMRFDGFAAFGPFPPLPLGVTSTFGIAPAEAEVADPQEQVDG